MLFIRQKKINPRLKQVLIIVLGLYIMLGTSLYLLQEKILFLPTILAQDYQFKFSHTFEELFLKTEDNVEINALHFKVENPKGIILYFHGNAGNLSRWGTIAEYFVDRNYDVLIMDYRTYGKSTGKLSEQALYKDAQVCYNYLKNNYQENEIIVYGRSLGTGIATHVAENNNPKQLILETPYYSMADIAHSRFPYFPTKYLLKYKFPTHRFIKDVSCPISMVHGTDDSIISIESAKKLYKVAPQGKTTFTEIKKGNHNDLIAFETFHSLMNTLLP